jgi:23S rRNA (guanosine2251-2'-O)-methyltransferase
MCRLHDNISFMRVRRTWYQAVPVLPDIATIPQRRLKWKGADCIRMKILHACYIGRMKAPKKTEKVYIYGRHSLVEALRENPKAIKTVFLANATEEEEIVQLAGAANIPVKQLGKGETNVVGKDAVHQGVIGVLNPDALFVDLKAFLKDLDTSTNPAIAVCAEVQDPHNLGAIIRSAAALGIAAVIFPEHRQVSVTGTVVKTSVGMVFRIPMIRVGNVNQTLRELKDAGFWIYGLDMNGEQLTETAFDRPSVFVVGNEGSGIREKSLELCDHVLSIPMHPRTESLNAAVSAAVVFYEWSRQHPGHLA